MSSVIVQGAADGFEMMSIEDLFTEFRNALGQTIEGFMRAARIIRVLEDKGVDTSPIKSAMYNVLRKVAYGQMIPELIMYIKDGSTFRKLSALPLPDQRRIASGEPLKVIEGIKDDNDFDFRMVPFDKMTDEQRRRVFGRDGIRTDEQQYQQIKGRPAIVSRSFQLKLTPKQEKKLAASADRRGVSIEKLFIETLEAADLI